jgi:hypothetical protein
LPAAGARCETLETKIILRGFLKHLNTVTNRSRRMMSIWSATL